MTEKIQYYMSDLAYKLGIGEIRNIHIADEGGRPVLRIECEEKSQYKTITATQKKEKKKAARKPALKKEPGESGSILDALPGPGKGSVFEKMMFGR